MIDTSARPDFYVIVGAPGTGKSSQIRLELEARRAPRLVVFDVEGEFGELGTVVRTLAELKAALIAAAPSSPARLVYQPRTDDPKQLRERFGVFCTLAFAACRLLIVVDELAELDSPNPHEVVPAWRRVLGRGRKRHLVLVGGTQRPADVNKRLWGFATRLRVGRLAYVPDRRELAGSLNVPYEDVAALIDTQWIERSFITGERTDGTLAWKGGRPANLKRQAPAAAAPAMEKKPPARRRAQ